MIWRAILLLSFTSLLSAGCSRAGETINCRPGELVTVGCDDEGLGTCTGDPVLIACSGFVSVAACEAGSGGCSGRGGLACNDDGGRDRCPRLSVTCPVSGRLTIAHDGFGSSAYTCNWETSIERAIRELTPDDAGAD